MSAFIRSAEPGDAVEAARVLRNSITELCTADHREDVDTLTKWLANKTPEQFGSWIADADSFCVVAEVDTQVVGVGLISRAGEVKLCYVNPGSIRRGIGKLLYQKLEEKAREWGVTRVTVESTSGAQEFYSGLGFHPVGEPKPGFGLSKRYPFRKRLLPSRP